jgi:capsule polysaccharide export protein KpsE/RkpR
MDEKQTQRVLNILSVLIVALLVFDVAWVIRAALSAH